MSYFFKYASCKSMHGRYHINEVQKCYNTPWKFNQCFQHLYLQKEFLIISNKRGKIQFGFSFCVVVHCNSYFFIWNKFYLKVFSRGLCTWRLNVIILLFQHYWRFRRVQTIFQDYFLLFILFDQAESEKLVTHFVQKTYCKRGASWNNLF